MIIYSKIVGIGSYLLVKCVINYELVVQLVEQGIEILDEWIVICSGIFVCYYVELGQFFSDFVL